MIENSIVIASEKWENTILEFLSKLYSGHWMPSHDIAHHRRVWSNAVNICKLKNPSIGIDEPGFFEKLIICCYFHDAGLLIDTGEYHGKESRKICERFLENNSTLVKFDKENLLLAIEKHDEKTFIADLSKKSQLLEILTLADDLDAFGAIGVYRYIEIYLLRGIQPENISQRILVNASQRFENIKNILSKNFISPDQFVKKFNILLSLMDTNNYKEDPITLVNWINEKIIKLKENPFEIFSQLTQNPTGRIGDFIDQFNIENQRIEVNWNYNR